jgi:hypothetical protein
MLTPVLEETTDFSPDWSWLLAGKLPVGDINQAVVDRAALELYPMQALLREIGRFTRLLVPSPPRPRQHAY